MAQQLSQRLARKLKGIFSAKDITADTSILNEEELSALENQERYHRGEYTFQGKTLSFPDAASFVAILREVFGNEIYKFETAQSEPYILDCGANIGLSAIYFKSIYPTAKVVAFEPDKEIYTYLKANVSKYDFQKLTLVNKGVWKENGVLEFKNEGADAGRISFEFDSLDFKSTQQIEVVRLSEYIDQPVSLLKIDIEGSEMEVLQEIEHKLNYVENIFIEYHSFEKSPQGLDIMLGILSRNKFRYYLDSPSRFRQKPFIDRTTLFSFDFLINIYAVRIPE